MRALSPGVGTEYKLSWTKGNAITTPGSRVGLCSSSARKVPEAALRWKRRGVKLYFPGSGRRRTGDVKELQAVEGKKLPYGGTHCCTLQHAVVGLPVHLSQCCPELCRLQSFLHHLHLQAAAAAAAEAQLWWTPDGNKPFRS